MSGLYADVMGSIRAVASPLLDPNTIFVFNPQRFRDLVSLAPPPVFDVEYGPSLMSIAWRAKSLFDVPRHLGLVSMAVVDAPESFELRCGPYEDVVEPWCVLKNLSTGRRLVVDWPLLPYYADRLVRRSS